jgi:hypothetical protein
MDQIHRVLVLAGLHEPVDQFHELGQAVGFGQESGQSFALELLDGIVFTVAAGKNDLGHGIQSQNGLESASAVQAWHGEIHDDQADLSLVSLIACHSLKAILGCDHFVAGHLQDLASRFP